ILSRPAEARQRASDARAWAERFSFEEAAAQTLYTFETIAGETAEELSLVNVEEPPRVFVVTPSFQQAAFLRATVDSVLAQDYPRLDYFVADGGSTDGSVDILRSYGERLSWHSGPDGGQAAAIAAAWRSSTADVVAWINSDDLYLPGAVTRAVEHLLGHPEQAMVYGRAWYIDAQGQRTGEYPTRPFDGWALRQDCFVCQPTAFVRREVFLRIGLPDVQMRFCMDYDLWIRLSREFEVGFLDEFLASARIHEDTKSLRERGAVYEEILRLTRAHFGVVPRDWLIGALLHRAEARCEGSWRGLPRMLRRRLAARLVSAEERRTLSTLHGDGWAGTRSLLEVRADDDGKIRLRAESPFWPYRRPLTVTVTHGWRTLARHRCKRRGEFRLEFAAPGNARAGERVQIQLRANRTFVPSIVRWTPSDPRPISFRVLEQMPEESRRLA
ncbi:MAG: glycosyltransferase family 2 protein, partial [Candidatus Binatia bacterium]